MKDWKIDPLSLFSHELKTPLSSLKLGLSLLEKDFEKHKKLLPLMQGELEAMIDFITDNLDLRFIQKKKDMFQWEWRSFDSLILKACSSFKLIAQKKDIVFKIERPKHEPELFVDVSWMLSLLGNLLSNALKFSPNKGKIFIQYGLDDKKRAFVCSVRDEGPGLKDSKKVFDSCYEGQTIKGSGLGLSISKAIIEAHGGSLSASSIKEGSLFCFVLPKARLIKPSAA